jgi:uncharacterized transporter YbjL
MTIFSWSKTLLATVTEKATGATGQEVQVSIFAIIIVGLIAGLIVGLVTGPTYTVQGFFLGFAGGSLITVAVYFFKTGGGHPA